jgi:predicted transcriptional regulator
MAFAIQLTTALRGAKMSRAELARRVHVSRSTVTEWASGKQRPRHEVLARINEVLGTRLTLARKITAMEVARGMGMHVDTLRRAMRMGMMQDIGVAIPSRGGERWCYRFYAGVVAEKLSL